MVKYLQLQKTVYFDMLYERYAKKVYAKSLSMLKNTDEAEDAVHDIFMKILLKLSKFNLRSKFSTWLYAITYNHCIDKIRLNKKRNINQIEDEMLDIPDGTEDNEKFLLEIKVERLGTILEKIPKEDKAILMMKYLEEMKIKEIAQITQRTDSAIKMQLKRARHKLERIYYQLYKD